jgi:hypothetical protein
MSTPVKIALFAMALVPVLAILVFWGRPARDSVELQPAALPSPPVVTAPSVAAAPSVAPVAPVTSPPALTIVRVPIVPLEPAPPSSVTVGDNETRARMMLRHRPSFLKGAPGGCDPPFTIDSEGNKHPKEGCN